MRCAPTSAATTPDYRLKQRNQSSQDQGQEQTTLTLCVVLAGWKISYGRKLWKWQNSPLAEEVLLHYHTLCCPICFLCVYLGLPCHCQPIFQVIFLLFPFGWVFSFFCQRKKNLWNQRILWQFHSLEMLAVHWLSKRKKVRRRMINVKNSISTRQNLSLVHSESMPHSYYSAI